MLPHCFTYILHMSQSCPGCCTYLGSGESFLSSSSALTVLICGEASFNGERQRVGFTRNVNVAAHPNYKMDYALQSQEMAIAMEVGLHFEFKLVYLTSLTATHQSA